MLNSNLDRSGHDLAIDANLAYFNVTTRCVGINTQSPGHALDVIGNAHLGNLYILGNTITSDTGKINLGAISNIVVSGGQPNYVVYTDGAGNLTFGNLTTLSGLEGFTGNNISLGSNTQGSLSNAIAFSQSTSITDAVADLNRLLGNITNSTGTQISVTGNVSGANIIGNIISPTIDSINAKITSANLAIAQIQSNVGAYEIYANLAINTINSNLVAFATYSNANASVQALSIQSLLTGANANTAAYLTTYTGNIAAGNFTGTLHGNVITDYILGYTGNVITVTGTGALKLPTGSTANRPAGVTGYVRFNTDFPAVEYYDGTAWTPVTNTVTDQQIAPNGTNAIYTLNQETTTVGIMVSINGVLQLPSTAYSVTGNQITFTQVPLTTDIIDIRFLGASVTMNNTLADNLTVAGNITLSGILSAPLTSKAATDPGTAGQVCWDTNYIYVCTAANTWKRSPLTGGY